MAESHQLGKEGETLAALYMADRGYRILERNWKSGRLEVDIIAENDDLIVFVEVKTRSDSYITTPVSAVDSLKQKSIVLVAENFLKNREIDKECRFDIITVIKKPDEHIIDHMENAFYPTLLT